MDDNTKELIAIGASVGAHCQPCLAYHIDKARAIGVGEEDIRAAIAMGHMVDTGAMNAMQEFTSSVLERTPGAAAGGACCGTDAGGGGCCC